MRLFFTYKSMILIDYNVFIEQIHNLTFHTSSLSQCHKCNAEDAMIRDGSFRPIKQLETSLEISAVDILAHTLLG